MQQTLPNWTKSIQTIPSFLRIVGYYAMGSNYVAKASTLFCLEASVGIACVLFQLPGLAWSWNLSLRNLGVLLTQVPATWPSSSSGVLPAGCKACGPPEPCLWLLVLCLGVNMSIGLHVPESKA